MDSGSVIRVILFVIVGIVAVKLLFGVLHWLIGTGITVAIVAGLIWLAWRLFGTKGSAY
jgi:hypothetical protein